MAKFKGKDYDKLNESSKKKLASFLEKVHKSGLKLSDLEKEKDDKNFAKYLGIKLGKKTKYGYSNVYSHRKIIRQIKGTSERKTKSVNRAIDKYIKEGWKGKGLVKVRKELVMASGSTFLEVYSKVEKQYPRKTTSQIQEYTRQLLKVPISEMDDLSDFDKETIEGYDTTP